MITSTKFYVPVTTLSINDNIKCLENINQGFVKQFLGISSNTTPKQEFF